MTDLLTYLLAHWKIAWVVGCAVAFVLVAGGDRGLAWVWAAVRGLAPNRKPPEPDKLLVARDACRELCWVLPDKADEIKDIVAGSLRSFL